MAEGRMKHFKNRGRGDEAELRRRRTEEAVEIRKNKRDDALAKRRHVTEDDDFDGKELIDLQVRQVLESLASDFSSSNPAQQLEAVFTIRKLLSASNVTAAYEEVLRMGFLPGLVGLLQRFDRPALQYEAAWCLTNIASGTSEQATAIVEHGALPILINLIGADERLSLQALWTLGNVAGDSPCLRDLVINNGIVEPLIQCVTNAVPLRHLRVVSWVVSNLCRYNSPSPSLAAVEKLLPVLQVLIEDEDLEVLKDVCWALSFLTDGGTGDSLVQAVVDSGVVDKLVLALNSNAMQILVPALRAIGNLASGSAEHTQLVIDAGSLPYFRRLLERPEERVRKEACWALSNVTAGTPSQIQAVTDAQLLPLLIAVFHSGEFLTKREAAWAITNFAIAGMADQLQYFVANNGVPLICDLLTFKDTQIVKVALNAMLALLQASGMMFEQLALLFEEGGACDRLEELHQHENYLISQMAADIVTKFFSAPADTTVLEIAPQQQSDSQFQFGLPSVGNVGELQFSLS